MRIILVSLITFVFISCTTEIKKNEDTFPGDSSRVKVEIEPIKKIQSKKLLEASFTEPFMYSEIFSDKIKFIRPEKDTLEMYQEFDPIALTKNLKLSFTQNKITYNIELIQSPCTHPGSGETWPITAKFMVNGVLYQGCARPAK